MKTLNLSCFDSLYHSSLYNAYEKFYKDLEKIFLLYLKTFYNLSFTDVKQIDKVVLNHFVLEQSFDNSKIIDIYNNLTVVTIINPIYTYNIERLTAKKEYVMQVPLPKIEITDWHNPLLNKI